MERLQGVEKVESKAKEEDHQEDCEEYGHLLWNGEVASLGVQQDEPSNPPKQVAKDRCSKESHQEGSLLVDADDPSDGEDDEDEVDGNIPATIPERLCFKLIRQKS